jgi:hypothetical protein
MIREKMFRVCGAVLICAGGVFAAYIEGTDTTDVNGYGLDSAFRVTGSGTSKGNALYLAIYGLSFGGLNSGGETGLFNYLFDEIKIAAANGYSITPECFHCFVIKSRDSTYSKVQILSQLTGNQYIFKYGTNTTPNNRMLESSTYNGTIRYKPNNAFNYYKYPGHTGGGFTGRDTLSWEPPLPNINHLLGYIFYRSKQGVVIDTTAPINPAQWDSIGYTNLTHLDISSNYADFRYYNLVAVYAEGKSDFLQGWTYHATFAVGVKQKWHAIDPQQNKIEIQKTTNGFLITFQPSPQTTGFPSLSIYNVNGEKVAGFPGIKGNQVYWKTTDRNLAEGQYIIKLELPDKSVISRTLIFSRK